MSSASVCPAITTLRWASGPSPSTSWSTWLRRTGGGGVIMLRRMVRQGIRTAARGEDPLGITHREGAVSPTYSHDRVLRIPRAPTLEEGRRLLLDTARQATIEYIQQLAPA